MSIPDFKGRKLAPAIKPRTVGEALNDKGEYIGSLHSGVFVELQKYLSDNFSGCDAVTKVYDTQDGCITGSNIFTAIATNEFLKKYGMEVATTAQIEKDIRNGNADSYRDRYHDLGLVLRNIEEPNVYHARKIAEQLPADMQLPAKLDIRDLKLELDQKAPEGVSFTVSNPKKAMFVPQFERQVSFDETDENGLPVEKPDGKRTSYVIDTGLSGLGLGGYLDLGSVWYGLADSNSDGRVAVVTEEE